MTRSTSLALSWIFSLATLAMGCSVGEGVPLEDPETGARIGSYDVEDGVYRFDDGLVVERTADGPRVVEESEVGRAGAPLCESGSGTLACSRGSDGSSCWRFEECHTDPKTGERQCAVCYGCCNRTLSGQWSCWERCTDTMSSLQTLAPY